MPSHDGAAWLLPGSAAAARGLLVLLAACGARSGGVPAADGGPGDLDATLTATDAGAGAVGPDAGLEAAARAAADIAAEATATVGPGVDGTGAPDIGADTSDAADGADAAKGADSVDVGPAVPPCPDVFLCKVHGRCSLVNGKCVALTDVDCKLSEGAHYGGQRHALDGKCVALGPIDCEYAASEYGFSTVKNGMCTVPAAGCKNGYQFFDGHCEKKWEYEPGVACEASKYYCKQRGRCTDIGGVCYATSAADCANSIACAYGGYCHLVGVKCGPLGDADCAKAGSCEDIGDCTYFGGDCWAASDANCAKATNKCEPIGSSGCQPFLKEHTYIGVACWGDKGFCRVHKDGYCSSSK